MSAKDDIAAAVRACLTDHSPQRVWVGFSGGADSTALLLAAARVVRTLPQTSLIALHVNHGLSAPASDWQAHCARLCEQLHVEFICDRVEVALEGNLEQNAREARYAAFRTRVGPGERLLLAHHQDDQTATLLMRLFQGRGFIAMRRHGRLRYEAYGEDGEVGEFARPLLDFSRAELCDYVTAAGFKWIEDASNLDEGFDRNYIRHRISGVIAQRWPGWQTSLLRVARYQQAMSDALLHALADVPDQFARARLPQAHTARRIWLRQYLAARDIHQVSDAALNAFLADLDASRAARLDLNSSRDCQAVLRLYKDQLYFEWEKSDGDAAAMQSVSGTARVKFVPGETIHLGWGTLRFVPVEETAKDSTNAAHCFACSESLYVRACRRDDRLQTGPDRFVLVKELLREAGIPPWRRAQYPAVCDDNGLLCIPEVRCAWRPHADGTSLWARACINSN